MTPFLKDFVRDLTFRGHSGFGSFLAWVVVIALLWAIAINVRSADLQGQIDSWRIPVKRIDSDHDLTRPGNTPKLPFKVTEDLSSPSVFSLQRPDTVTFHTDKGNIVVSLKDGSVKLNGLKIDEASREFWNSLRRTFPGYVSNSKPPKSTGRQRQNLFYEKGAPISLQVWEEEYEFCGERVWISDIGGINLEQESRLKGPEGQPR